MKKIALITHYYPAHRGGVEIAAYNIAKELSRTGRVEIILCSSDCDKPPLDEENFHSLPLKSTNFIEKVLPFPYPIILPSSVIKLYQIIRDSNIVHIHDFLYMSNIFAFIFAKFLKKKIFITQHIGFIPYNNPLLRFILSTLNVTLGRLILTNSDATIFISKNVLNYFSDICKNTRNFHFNPNPTDTDIFKVYDEIEYQNIRSKYNLNRFTFLFVGRFTEKKGLPLIRKVVESISDCDFLFAGWGTINPLDWNLKNVRVFTGLQGDGIAELYNAADLLILPSYGEGFPLVVQEALNCGLDIAVSREIVNASDEIDNFTSVIYENESLIDEFIEKIKYFIDNYQYSYKSRIEKSNYFKQLWNKQINTDKYLDIFFQN